MLSIISDLESRYEQDFNHLQTTLADILPIAAGSVWDAGNYSADTGTEQGGYRGRPLISLSTGSPHMGNIRLDLIEGDSAQLDLTIQLIKDLQNTMRLELKEELEALK
ncbi:MAG TPA: hypothetical protein EYQ25_03855 [Planctomycetes bacterium]|nr:hypothetical protein [Planctomycetota bacterium]HIL36054.1 hypothetical protein [Planctomycetota bacterium]